MSKILVIAEHDAGQLKLATLSASELEWELVESRRMLEIDRLSSDLDRVMLSFFRDITGEDSEEILLHRLGPRDIEVRPR